VRVITVSFTLDEADAVTSAITHQLAELKPREQDVDKWRELQGARILMMAARVAFEEKAES
jgi:hypothetical protein